MAENTSLRQIINEREAEVANLKAALKSDGKKKEEAELSRREAAGKPEGRVSGEYDRNDEAYRS